MHIYAPDDGFNELLQFWSNCDESLRLAETMSYVLCEKPMALNLQQAKVMVERADAAGVKHMVLLTWRWQPALRYMKQLVNEGFIGRCNLAVFRFCTPNGRQPEYNWQFDPNRSNGVIGILGFHMIDFTQWYVGEITGMSARLVTCVERPGADGRPAESANDLAFINLRFANGAHATIHMNMVAHEPEMELFLQGDSGALRTTSCFATGFTLEGLRHDEPRFQPFSVPDEIQQDVDPTVLHDPYVKQSAGPRYFIDAILEDRIISPRFADGMKVQEAIDAAFESQKSGCWVDLGCGVEVV